MPLMTRSGNIQTRILLIFMGITHLGVDRFYNSDVSPISLTIVARKNG